MKCFKQIISYRRFVWWHSITTLHGLTMGCQNHCACLYFTITWSAGQPMTRKYRLSCIAGRLESNWGGGINIYQVLMKPINSNCLVCQFRIVLLLCIHVLSILVKSKLLLGFRSKLILWTTYNVRIEHYRILLIPIILLILNAIEI